MLLKKEGVRLLKSTYRAAKKLVEIMILGLHKSSILVQKVVVMNGEDI